MRNFNLLVSTSRFNETNAKAELWFTLFMCGDTYPIISQLTFPGLVTALTNLDPKIVISKINDITSRDPKFFQFILKIIPIDFICETKTEIIKQIVREKQNNFINKDDSFKISLKRRHHKKIDRNSFIEKIADQIDNKVDLNNPDITIRIEMLGNISGISFLRKNNIVKI
ncbi:MAG: THUMP domain-containing protein [Candidatus Thorarchaeota archaeon]